ncbi:Flp family type IVb pilin [Variovorax sp. JS1663]|uniref:Flp family type IVb pilin n=1 Tax=Variovorax sp. JS1663 TaxID=1851577 RepID=UPI000B3463DB|nr:Flp family type IVb pilin [Variovorax sp. JS1663]OUL98487.1 pilus assembly protein [Variovorax sp. JS1663]
MLKKFLSDEEGAQVIEYALIIAAISIVLVLALQPLLLGTGIGALVTRVVDCLTGTCS